MENKFGRSIHTLMCNKGSEPMTELAVGHTRTAEFTIDFLHTYILLCCITPWEKVSNDSYHFHAISSSEGQSLIILKS